jgi:AcrR family transcriptional regulator
MEAMATRHKRHGARKPRQHDRKSRERAIVAATRALWDERGRQTASIEEIASAVGLARGLMYRQFSSKEELFVLTTADYLEELDELLATATASETTPAGKLERVTQAYAGYCGRYPAYLDCSNSLLQRPARELSELVSESIWLRLGQSMGRCLDLLADVLREGVEAGDFAIDDPDYMANVLWAQMQGAMGIARLGVGVRLEGPSVPGLFRIDPEAIVATCVKTALATVTVR